MTDVLEQAAEERDVTQPRNAVLGLHLLSQLIDILRGT